MAPRGGRGTTTGRDSTMKAKNPKTSRSGIQKRGREKRVDGDGDLDMDSAGTRSKKTSSSTSNPTRSRPSTRSTVNLNAKGPSKTAQNVLKHLSNGTAGSLASRVSNAASGKGKTRQNNANLTFLRVGGLRRSKAANNPGGGLNDLLGFLERKAATFLTGRKKTIAIKKSHYVGDYVYIGTNDEDAEEILKLNTFTFAGAQLEITKVKDVPSSGAVDAEFTADLRGKLQGILQSRYIGGENKLLKLDSLASDAQLVNLGMFETPDRALKTFKGLMAVCDSLFKTDKDKREAIESISLASNNIDNVSQVEVVATTFPHLKNLDMSGNQIGSMQSLNRWKGKFRYLETLYMSGNPIETVDLSYQATLLEWFPKLRIVNGNELRTAAQIAEQEAALRPKPIPQNGPDFRDVGGVGENFLLEFFACFDNDRMGLASRYYDEDSQFSVSIDTHSVRDADAPPPMAWGGYVKLSRNLTKITHQNARVQRLFKGGNTIGEAWKTLPPTRHPDIKQELSKYIMDCHPMPGLMDPNGPTPGVDGLIIAVHGEFEEHNAETNTTGKRSFSRTFLLGPAKTGRGIIRVVSDMLSLRAYSPLPNVFAPSAPAPAPVNQHQAMIAELSKQTRMTPEYSEMCLTQVNWEFDKALIIFNEKKSQLPAEAFAAA